MTRIIGRLALTLLAGAALLPASAAAAPLSHGQVLRVVKARTAVNATQSNNWFGYGQGELEQGGRQFHSVAGQWIVPAASSHGAGQAGSSSDWVGIGGGCVDASCSVGDQTLIQVGTEQDVDNLGRASYSAWYELVPGPSFTISGMRVAPGDQITASVAETPFGSEQWTITISDVTRHETFSTHVAYSSSYATAEWIEETPIVVNPSGAGFATLPNLTTIPFDRGATDGSSAGLKPPEEIQLTDSSGNVISVPSSPDPEADGFAACTWTTTCATPGGAGATPGGGPNSAVHGPACTVPRLKGMRLAGARRALRRAGCRLGHVKRRRAHGRRRGTIISQSARPGSRLPAGSRVRVAVAR